MQTTYNKSLVTYRARSLSDIADDFEQREKQKRQNVETTLGLTQRQKAEYLAEAEIWRQAAHVLRNTTLQQDAQPAEEQRRG